MANVLSEEKRQQVLALGRLGWSLRRIEEATSVRRETASGYLKKAGVAVRSPRKRRLPKPASVVSTDFEPGAKPASVVSTDSDVTALGREVRPGRSPSASACEPHREMIEGAISRGRNAMAIWQDLVEDHGFEHKYSSVKRFVAQLRGR